MVSRLPEQSDESTPASDESDEVAPLVSGASGASVPLTRRRRAAKKTMSVVPTMITLGNLVCGFLAIFLASKNPETSTLPFGWSPLTIAAMWVFIGMVLDSLDGRVARLTGTTSELGEQLDSFADMVTFGVAPAFMGVMLVGLDIPFFEDAPKDPILDRFVLVAASLYLICAALRLARFNIETTGDGVEDHLSFKGLPSPGAAGTVVSIILVHEHLLRPFMSDYLADPIAAGSQDEPWGLWLTKLSMILVMGLVGMAMVSRLRYTHAMNKYVRGDATLNFIVIAVIILALIAIFPQYTFAAAMIGYALSAPLLWLWFKITKKPGMQRAMMVLDDDEEVADEGS